MAITKEQFLNQEVFSTINPRTTGAPTYKVERSSGGSKYLVMQVRSNNDDRILLENCHLNLTEVTDEGFTGFTTVLGELVERRVEFEDLYLVE